jgi:hypothetical protein
MTTQVVLFDPIGVREPYQTKVSIRGPNLKMYTFHQLKIHQFYPENPQAGLKIRLHNYGITRALLLLKPTLTCQSNQAGKTYPLRASS